MSNLYILIELNALKCIYLYYWECQFEVGVKIKTKPIEPQMSKQFHEFFSAPNYQWNLSANVLSDLVITSYSHFLSKSFNLFDILVLPKVIRETVLTPAVQSALFWYWLRLRACKLTFSVVQVNTFWGIEFNYNVKIWHFDCYCT